MADIRGVAASPMYPAAGSPDEEAADVVVDAETEKLSKFTKLISPLFLVYGVFVIVCTILSIIKVDGSEGWVTFFFVVIATVVFSVIAALGVYKWGTVEEQIDVFKEQNEQFQAGIDELKETKDQLKGEVAKLSETTKQLNRDVDSLKQTLGQYDELKNSLQLICGDNQKLNDMINDINNMYGNMKETIIANTRAGILSAYYDAAFRDDDEGMTRKEWKRFLAKLDNKTGELFSNYGSFESIAGDDDVIDKMEFQRMVDDVLTNQADAFLEEAKRQSVASNQK
mmetsp:Transcript_10246/g.15514  ORF Transcript_10246/g.15514 Transcript_10246/m.15514 type:complete len:283 (+) Transcript_10246:110-958(+)|eukprot:CAMPEP_0202687278 /NCGR_PEP_ID=MMETSP1385-20130828/2977_1 /ASSEMBLY_ACC=CAM_ASM_000861 /TAXON_ID=933848 /ORGANISM="Elphidium margaritaceum" /LENGTH=282 /DNA_ID=CAMNT_0049342041 /DNA_START=91 /DNA_END=939 /DNA_ORIENTATION=+